MPCTFQAPVDRKFAPLIGVRDDDLGIHVDAMITVSNKAVTGRANRYLGNLQLYQNHRLIGLISHLRKIKLKVILNMRKDICLQIGFTAGRKTAKQVRRATVLTVQLLCLV